MWVHGKRDFLEIPASTRLYYARPAEEGGQTPLRQLEEQAGAEAARF